MVTSLFRLGRIRGVDRPRWRVPFPPRLGPALVLDIGANPDCKPENLLQFGIMGSVYAEKVRGVKNPKVGLISNGEEAGKGSELVKGILSAAAKLQRSISLEMWKARKSSTAMWMWRSRWVYRKCLLESHRSGCEITDRQNPGDHQGWESTDEDRRCCWSSRHLGSIKKMLDPSEEGAAPLLGVNGLVFIGHGRSDALAIKNAVRVAKGCCGSESARRHEVCDRGKFKVNRPIQLSPKIAGFGTPRRRSCWRRTAQTSGIEIE